MFDLFIRSKIMLSLAFLMVFTLPQEAGACYGSRPLGMGGAYVALAEGAEAIYWNPGGIVFSETSTFSSTQSIPPEEINYQSFLGVTLNQENIALGFGYTGHSDFVYDRYWVQMVSSVKVLPWLGIGFGKRIAEPWWGEIYQETDIGIQAHWDRARVSFGLLLQSIDTPGYNIRPGIAVKGKNYTIAVDIYDFTNNHGAFSTNLGFEYRLPFDLGVRLGLYQYGNEDGYVKTIGLGKVFGNFTLDGVYLIGTNISSYQVTAGYKF